MTSCLAAPQAIRYDAPGMSNPLKLYDNFTRTLRPFEPLEKGGAVGLYTWTALAGRWATSFL